MNFVWPPARSTTKFLSKPMDFSSEKIRFVVYGSLTFHSLIWFEVVLSFQVLSSAWRALCGTPFSHVYKHSHTYIHTPCSTIFVVSMYFSFFNPLNACIFCEFLRKFSRSLQCFAVCRHFQTCSQTKYIVYLSNKKKPMMFMNIFMFEFFFPREDKKFQSTFLVYSQSCSTHFPHFSIFQLFYAVLKKKKFWSSLSQNKNFQIVLLLIVQHWIVFVVFLFSFSFSSTHTLKVSDRHHHVQARYKPTSFRLAQAYSFLRDANISPNKQSTKTRALWASGQVRPFVYRELIGRVAIMMFWCGWGVYGCRCVPFLLVLFSLVYDLFVFIKAYHKLS